MNTRLPFCTYCTMVSHSPFLVTQYPHLVTFNPKIGSFYPKIVREIRSPTNIIQRNRDFNPSYTYRIRPNLRKNVEIPNPLSGTYHNSVILVHLFCLISIELYLLYKQFRILYQSTVWQYKTGHIFCWICQFDQF